MIYAIKIGESFITPNEGNEFIVVDNFLVEVGLRIKLNMVGHSIIRVWKLEEVEDYIQTI